MVIRRVGAPVATSVLAVLAAGCTVQVPAEPISAGPPEVAPQPSGHYRFDQTYDKGAITTTVGKPREFTTSPYSPQQEQRAWAVDVRYTNETPAPMPLNRMRVSGTTDGRVSTDVIDPAQGFQGPWMAPVLAPGQSVTMPLAFTGAGRVHEVTVSSENQQTAVSWSE